MPELINLAKRVFADADAIPTADSRGAKQTFYHEDKED